MTFKQTAPCPSVTLESRGGNYVGCLCVMCCRLKNPKPVHVSPVHPLMSPLRSSCRFFFPFPKQPQQQQDENMDRVAVQRRHIVDDVGACDVSEDFPCVERCSEVYCLLLFSSRQAWVNTHNPYLAMFSTSSIHLQAFVWHLAASLPSHECTMLPFFSRAVSEH